MKIENVCSYAISGAVHMCNGKAPSEVTKKNALLLIFNTFIKWMHIRFRIPKYFFKVRYVYYSDNGKVCFLALKVWSVHGFFLFWYFTNC